MQNVRKSMQTHPTRRDLLVGSLASLAAVVPLIRAKACSQSSGETWVSPEDFRSRGAGDFQALTRFAAALGNGVNGRIDRDYVIPRSLTFVDKSRFALRGTGRLRIANGAPTNELHAALYFQRCSDFIVEGLSVDGNRANRNAREDSGHLIQVIECHRATFRSVSADNGICDGWYVSATASGNGPGGGPLQSELPSDLLFEECRANNNWRQGMSIIDGHRITVRRGRYANTRGSWDQGRGPAAGIDIEPNSQPSWIRDRVRDVLIDRVQFEANQGFGLQVTNTDGVHGVVVRDCIFRNNQLGGLAVAAGGTRVIRPVFDGWDDSAYTGNPAAPPKRGLIYIPNGALGPIVVERPIFRNISSRSHERWLIYTRSRSPGTTIVSPDVGGTIMPLLNDERRASVISGDR